MGLTYEQARSLNIGHLHPDAPGAERPGRTLLDVLAEAADADPHPLSIRRADPDDGMTKLERRFRDDVLMPALGSRHIAGFWREPMSLRLGGRCFYRSDFLVAEWSGDHGLPPRLTMIETKGYMREDACVKLKVAAGMFYIFRWLLVTRPAKAWEVHEVTGAGIGRNPIRVPWINGMP